MLAERLSVDGPSGATTKYLVVLELSRSYIGIRTKLLADHSTTNWERIVTFGSDIVVVYGQAPGVPIADKG